MKETHFLLAWSLLAFMIMTATRGTHGFVTTAERHSSTTTSSKTTRTNLIPPKSIEDLLSDQGGDEQTTELYDQNVQKTYGYVVE